MNKVSDFTWKKNYQTEIVLATPKEKVGPKTYSLNERTIKPSVLRWYIMAMRKPLSFIIPGESTNEDYWPLSETPELFLEFMGLDIDDDKKVIQFADNYGLLGGECAFVVSYQEQEKEDIGEALSFWGWEQKWLHIAFFLWSFLKHGHAEYIPGNFIKKNKIVLFRPHYHDQLMSEMGELGVFFTNIFVANIDEIYEGYQSTKEREKYLCKSLLKNILDTHLENRFSFRLNINSLEEASIDFIPESLVGAIWLQLSMAITKVKDFIQCLECKKWIEVSSEGARKDVKYCSNACRVKAYRKRKKEKLP